MKRIASTAFVAGIFYLCAVTAASATDSGTVAQAIANPNNPNENGGQNRQNLLDAISRTPFTSASGYVFKLSQSEDGMILEIAGSDGAAKRMSFSLYDNRSGTVFDEDHNAAGRFWITSKEIYIRYRDGWSEAIWPSSSGNLQMAQKAPNGNIHYTTWYSRDRLLSANGPAGNKPDAKPTPAPAIATLATQSVAPLQAITVQTSAIHIIDQPVALNPVVAGGASEAAPRSFQLPQEQSAEQPQAVSNPSQCLSVESNGMHWGFRNSCAYDIQFAYCVASSADQLTSCKDGAITGSVAPHGFGALTADRSIGDSSADHDFRWIACDGGAGEVVPHLDRSDPPTGHCLRANAS